MSLNTCERSPLPGQSIKVSCQTPPVGTPEERPTGMATGWSIPTFKEH